jgi:peptidoglycan/xylan/chitin deacetylase (PgdA/CDA1 family)
VSEPVERYDAPRRNPFGRRLLPFIYLICGLIGITALFYALNRQRRLVLTYHNIIPDELFDNALHLGVSHRLSEFEKQLDVVSERFNITTNLFSAGMRSCVITFDDGYQNNLLAAARLERKGVRGMFFVPVEPVLSGNTLAIDRVMQWFSYAPPGVYRLDSETIEIVEAERREAFSRFYSWMRRKIELWDRVPDLLDACFPFSNLPKLDERYEALRFRPMNRETLTELRKKGHAVGCHSWNHRPLASLSDADLRADFESSAANNELFNVEVYSFPFGDAEEVDERAIRLCKFFGYNAGLANLSNGGDNPMALPRESLPRETNHYVLDAKLSGLESFIKRLCALVTRPGPNA